MVFSDSVFLLLFLPAILAVYFLGPVRLRTLVLLVFSLAFYAYGEGRALWVMLASIAINYGAALLVDSAPSQRGRLAWLVGAVAANLGLLVYFKYANFLANAVDGLSTVVDGPSVELAPIHLPIGISFFTFQSLSYVIDVYRRIVPAQRSVVIVATYVSLFPQLVAGPIVRYVTVARELVSRKETVEGFAEGARRFVIGLAKKVLLADPAGGVADRVFALPLEQLATGNAWLGTIAYTLQIYLDFSAYSDMAIGLGRIFGFYFPENFDYPYVSRSITEFWRRWHISLSTWFRDYLYIPLGGNRGGPWVTYRNLLIVFVLCGLWHGASWTFLAWGVYHGAFLVVERAGFGARLVRLWRPLQHVYAMTAVFFGWVLFRAETFQQAWLFAVAMLGGGNSQTLFPPAFFVDSAVLTMLVLGMVATTPIAHVLRDRFVGSGDDPSAQIWLIGRLLLYPALLLISLARVSADAHSPFIYFRF